MHTQVESQRKALLDEYEALVHERQALAALVAASAKAEVAAAERIAAELEAVDAEAGDLERERARLGALLRRRQQATPTRRPKYLAETVSSHSKVAAPASARRTRPCINNVQPCVTTRAVAP